jgi:Transposase, Mutator family
MTDQMMNLRTLLEKTPDADLLCEMIGFAAQRLMELEVEGLTGAIYGEKSQYRLVQRNGYRDRIWETCAGSVELRIPSCAKARIPRQASTHEKGEGCACTQACRDLAPDVGRSSLPSFSGSSSP